MVTDDAVDDDSDAVSGNNDYNIIGGCHYMWYLESLLHIQLRYSEPLQLWRASSVGANVFQHTDQQEHV